MAESQRSIRPKHVAIVMDGNGRWARNRGLPRLAGHRQGVETVRKIVEACEDADIRWLTLFAFSTENWKRPAEEVEGLMKLFRIYMAREAQRLLSNDVRLRFIGRREGLPDDVVAMMADLEAQSVDKTKFNLNIALNYGGRDEIMRTARALAQKVKDGELDPSEIDEATLGGHMDTRDIPDPCLVIRTSGESRISNFLLWQAAYAEYEFVDTLWPDFSPEEFASIVDSFGKRERRFGAVAG